MSDERLPAHGLRGSDPVDRSEDGTLAWASYRGCRMSAYIPVGVRIVKGAGWATATWFRCRGSFGSSGYAPGSSVLVEQLPDGELRIPPTNRIRDRIRHTARRFIAEHPEALDILAKHRPVDDPPYS